MLVKALAVLALANAVMAVCPGFNWAIGNVKHLANGKNQWTVYDDSCNPWDYLTTSGNPCNQGIFGCSPPPVIFNKYWSTITGLAYSCRKDPNSGVCHGDVISVCCRNDGH